MQPFGEIRKFIIVTAAYATGLAWAGAAFVLVSMPDVRGNYVNVIVIPLLLTIVTYALLIRRKIMTRGQINSPEGGSITMNPVVLGQVVGVEHAALATPTPIKDRMRFPVGALLLLIGVLLTLLGGVVSIIR